MYLVVSKTIYTMILAIAETDKAVKFIGENSQLELRK